MASPQPGIVVVVVHLVAYKTVALLNLDMWSLFEEFWRPSEDVYSHTDCCWCCFVVAYKTVAGRLQTAGFLDAPCGRFLRNFLLATPSVATAFLMPPLPRVALALRWLVALTQGATAAQPPSSPPSSTPEITAADRYAAANTLPPPPPTAPPSALPFPPFAPSSAPGFFNDDDDVYTDSHDDQLHKLGVVVVGVGTFIAACAYWKRRQQANPSPDPNPNPNLEAAG